MVKNTWPVIYNCGDSYSDDSYQSPKLQDKVYCNYLAKELGNGFVMNNAKSGSCNRRIIRTSLHDLIQLREQNPDQQIIATIQLSFELRSELWYEDVPREQAVESNFHKYQFTGDINWKDKLMRGLSINKSENKFIQAYTKGYAYFYSPYAQRIQLYTDLVMFLSVCDQYKIDALIFQGPYTEKLRKEYLMDFFKDRLDKRVIPVEEFQFCVWCGQRKFKTLDRELWTGINHYGSDAHEEFAKIVLIPKLKELKYI